MTKPKVNAELSEKYIASSAEQRPRVPIFILDGQIKTSAATANRLRNDFWLYLSSSKSIKPRPLVIFIIQPHYSVRV